MAVLTSEERDRLPDSAFAAVYTVKGEKVRKFPVHDAAHVRDALARFSGARLPGNVVMSTHAKIAEAAQRFGVEVNK